MKKLRDGEIVFDEAPEVQMSDAWHEANVDVAMFGTGVVHVADNGDVTHIPLRDIEPRPYGSNAMFCQLKNEIGLYANDLGIPLTDYLIDVATPRRVFGKNVRMAVAFGSRVVVRWAHFEELLDSHRRWQLVQDLVDCLESDVVYMSKDDIKRRRLEAMQMHGGRMTADEIQLGQSMYPPYQARSLLFGCNLG